MKKIVVHLWYDKEAKEAAELYVDTIGGDSKIESVQTIHDTPSGDCDIVAFNLAGVPFTAISAGPVFKFNPSISFHIKCASSEEADRIWNKLIVGGKAMMELGEYPWSKRYGWLVDKFGLSWQIIQVDGEMRQKITPVLMYCGAVQGKAEEAVNFYGQVFPDSKVDMVSKYQDGEGQNVIGQVKYAGFKLFGQEFGAMDSGVPQEFTFSEAISLLVSCEDQKEIDNYWEKLSAVPESEQCGWLKDKYGVSWQITPANLQQLMQGDNPEKAQRVTQAFLKMKKFDIATLEKAAEGE